MHKETAVNVKSFQENYLNQHKQEGSSHIVCYFSVHSLLVKLHLLLLIFKQVVNNMDLSKISKVYE